MGFTKPERKWFEHILVVALVVVVGFLVASNLYYQDKAGKQKMLFYQLQILRSSINLYKFIKGQNPPSLEVLAAGIYKFPGEELARRYIENAPIDKDGKVVDPFGKMYYYNGQTGWIRSSSSGYEFW
jgi:competence protein ComGC